MFIIRFIFDCCFGVLLKATIDKITAEFEVILKIGSFPDALASSLGKLNNFNPIGDLGAIKKFITYGNFKKQREC